MQVGKLKFSNLTLAITVIGTVLSIGLGFLSIYLSSDAAINVLVGLTGVVITLLIDFTVELKESEANIVEILKLSEDIAQDPPLLSAISQMTKDYLRVKRQNGHGSDYFDLLADAHLNRCKGILHQLAEGRLEIENSSTLSFRKSGAKFVEKEMLLVQEHDPQDDPNSISADYTAQLAQARRNGVQITRIWVQPKVKLDEYRQIMQHQKEQQIDVFVIEKENPELQGDWVEDFGIIDGSMIVKPMAHRKELITIDANEVAIHREKWEALWLLRTSLDTYFSRQQVK